MLPFKILITLASRNPIISMVHLVLFLLPLISLAGCANDGTEGPITSPNNAPQSSVAQADDGEDPKIDVTSTATDVTAQIAWDPPSDFQAAGYNIHYGKRSSEESNPDEPEPSVCSSQKSQTVEDTHTTITGLEPNTEYFLAIQAFNETDSLCSNAITIVTPPIQS
ncbi:fibronectin type III domain-containing protein [Nitrospira sp. CMX1]|nr:fibronectin type III domain-containing protein [Nitrospira sp.]MBS0168702.1 fibronectin type III domain-containing protein [Nitrospira sp.]